MTGNGKGVDKVGTMLGGRQDAIQGLGLLSDDPISLVGSPRRALAAYLEEKLQFREAEYDKIILQHKIEIKKSDGTREEHCIILDINGEPNGPTACYGQRGRESNSYSVQPGSLRYNYAGQLYTCISIFLSLSFL